MTTPRARPRLPSLRARAVLTGRTGRAAVAALLVLGVLGAIEVGGRGSGSDTAAGSPGDGAAATPSGTECVVGGPECPPVDTSNPAGDGVTTAPPAPSAPPAAEPPPPTDRARPAPAPAAPAGPVVRRPPPRPSRTSEAATQPGSPGAPAADPTQPAPPRSTVRYPQDFPDPFLFRAGPYWYAMSTQRNLAKVPVIRSTDLVHWEERGDALPALPQWSHFGAVWAPAVLAVPAGFVLYYSTPDTATGLQCLSMAVSALPEGPYVDTSSGPLVCQTDRGGSIDPSPFIDAEGRPWLAWKSEGTVDGEPTRLWSQPLTEDGRALLGQPTELLHTTQPWEQPIVEAPAMVRAEDGRFHLFYSGNRWETSSYAVGHALCDGPAGPCRRTTTTPVLTPHATEAGAGGGDVFRDLDGSLRFAYHAWDPAAVGYPGGLRRLRIGAVHLDPATGRAAVEPLPV